MESEALRKPREKPVLSVARMEGNLVDDLLI